MRGKDRSEDGKVGGGGKDTQSFKSQTPREIARNWGTRVSEYSGKTFSGLGSACRRGGRDTKKGSRKVRGMKKKGRRNPWGEEI